MRYSKTNRGKVIRFVRLLQASRPIKKKDPLPIAETHYVRWRPVMCVMATLFLAMITNAMFYKSDDEKTLNSETITIGPISLTPQDISNSLFSSLIVFPPVLMIAYFFSKSERQSETGSKRRSLCNPMLPYWFAYIAWFMVALSILVSAFFTVLYSFEWGRVKSTAWLTAFLLSFFESVIIIQPAKVNIFLRTFSQFLGFVVIFVREFGHNIMEHNPVRDFFRFLRKFPDSYVVINTKKAPMLSSLSSIVVRPCVCLQQIRRQPQKSTDHLMNHVHDMVFCPEACLLF